MRSAFADGKPPRRVEEVSTEHVGARQDVEITIVNLRFHVISTVSGGVLAVERALKTEATIIELRLFDSRKQQYALKVMLPTSVWLGERVQA